MRIPSVNLLGLLTLLGIALTAVGLFLPARRVVRPTAERMECANHLRQIALAIHEYTEVYHGIPPAHTVDSKGQPLHSWRTLLLPFLNQRALYESIDLPKPWDDPVNAPARNTNVSLFRCPSGRYPAGYTAYLAVVSPNSYFRLTEPRAFTQVDEGPSTTLMLIEVDAEHAVPWMSPQDADESLLLSLNPQSDLPHPGIIHAVTVSGIIDNLPATMPAAERRALVRWGK